MDAIGAELCLALMRLGAGSRRDGGGEAGGRLGGRRSCAGEARPVFRRTPGSLPTARGGAVATGRRWHLHHPGCIISPSSGGVVVLSDLREQLQYSLGGGFRLSRELGGGGMAKVFVADDAIVGRRVVVKVLAPELAAGVNLERFHREIQVAGMLHHPGIVPVLSAGQTDDILYYTMPYIEGDSLRALIEREQQLSVERALEIARDVTDALVHAHAHNIVHRDIKPDNILIESATGRAVVTDFGIARAIEKAADISSVTSTGLTLGTPTYMSPEQAGAEKHVDGRSDIYSLARAKDRRRALDPTIGLASPCCTSTRPGEIPYCSTWDARSRAISFPVYAPATSR